MKHFIILQLKKKKLQLSWTKSSTYDFWPRCTLFFFNLRVCWSINEKGYMAFTKGVESFNTLSFYKITHNCLQHMKPPHSAWVFPNYRILNCSILSVFSSIQKVSSHILSYYHDEYRQSPLKCIKRFCKNFKLVKMKHFIILQLKKNYNFIW